MRSHIVVRSSDPACAADVRLLMRDLWPVLQARATELGSPPIVRITIVASPRDTLHSGGSYRAFAPGHHRIRLALGQDVGQRWTALGHELGHVIEHGLGAETGHSRLIAAEYLASRLGCELVAAASGPLPRHDLATQRALNLSLLRAAVRLGEAIAAETFTDASLPHALAEARAYLDSGLRALVYDLAEGHASGQPSAEDEVRAALPPLIAETSLAAVATLAAAGRALPAGADRATIVWFLDRVAGDALAAEAQAGLTALCACVIRPATTLARGAEVVLLDGPARGRRAQVADEPAADLVVLRRAGRLETYARAAVWPVLPELVPELTQAAWGA